MSEPTKPSGLAAAVCAVMAEVGYVEKTGENKFHRYKYASDADLLGAVQPAMAKNGLMLHPRHVEKTTTEHGKTKAGGDQWRTDIVVTYSLLHTSGEHVDVVGLGCGIDGEDKGAYKAMTGALKYALRQTFLIPTGDDPERDSDHRPPQQPQQQRPAQQPQQPAQRPAQQAQQQAKANVVQHPATQQQKPAAAPAQSKQPEVSEALTKARGMALAMLREVPQLTQFIPGSHDDAHADRVIRKCKGSNVRMSETGAAAHLCQLLDAEMTEAEDAARAELERSGDPFEARV